VEREPFSRSDKHATWLLMAGEAWKRRAGASRGHARQLFTQERASWEGRCFEGVIADHEPYLAMCDRILSYERDVHCQADNTLPGAMTGRKTPSRPEGEARNSLPARSDADSAFKQDGSLLRPAREEAFPGRTGKREARKAQRGRKSTSLVQETPLPYRSRIGYSSKFSG
jgi:hypothetical protein